MCLFFFKQKTAYEMRISDWSSDVCSSDLSNQPFPRPGLPLGPAPMTDGPTVTLAADFPAITLDDVRAAADRINGAVVRTPTLKSQTLSEMVGDRKSVVEGKSVSVRGDLGGRRIIKKKNNTQNSINE